MAYVQVAVAVVRGYKLSKTIDIDPITRIEGHFAIRLETDEGRVTKAYCAGEMFRGFEVLLRGRSPMDAQQITQRICGVCPISHGLTSILAQEKAYGVRPPRNGRLMRNIILAANYIQSHLVHFYQLAALDFVDIKAVLEYKGNDPGMGDLRDWARAELSSGGINPVAPFLPRYSGTYITDRDLNLGAINNYLKALKMRALAHQLVALFGGKAPHATAMIPGGMTERVTAQNRAAALSIIRHLLGFVESAYLPDVLAVARALPEYFQVGRGCGNFLAYGVFPDQEDGTGLFFPGGFLGQGQFSPVDQGRITEDAASAYFTQSSALHPSQGRTDPAPDKDGAYSWVKAPRYDGLPCEVGPLARLLVAYHQGHFQVKELIDRTTTGLGRPIADLDSCLGRHAARALECLLVAQKCAEWADELVPGQAGFTDFDIPKSGRGVGLSEAPRGALGHWLSIEDYHIQSYQCVVPTTWNCSPRDEQGRAGPVEQALVGTPVADPDQPLEAVRVVRSFDPCLACAVH